MNNERPLAVTRGVQLLYASFAIGFVSAIANIAFKDSGVTMLIELVILISFFSWAALFVNKISKGKK